MFDFIDNQNIRIIVEISIYVLTSILSFLGGCSYANKRNKVGVLNKSNKNTISQKIE